MSLLYLALVITWPFPPARYLIPLVPAIYFFLFRGVQATEIHLNNLMTSEARKKILRHLVRVIFALIVVLHVGWISNYLFRKDCDDDKSLVRKTIARKLARFFRDV